MTTRTMVIVITIIILACVGCATYYTSTWVDTYQETQNRIAPENQERITPTMTLAPEPTPEPEYVTCSEYTKVSDFYKTPSGHYIVVDNETINVDQGIYNVTTKKTSVKVHKRGSYILGTGTNVGVVLYDYVSDPRILTPVSESESGYRDACRWRRT